MRITLSAFLLAFCASATGLETPQTRVETIVQSSQSWNGSSLPMYPSGKPVVTILKITIPPGVSLPVHQHHVINAGVLLEGELTVHTEAGDTLHMKQGDPIVEVVNQWHHGVNEGTVPAVILVFYAGAQGEVNTQVRTASEAQ